MVELNHLFFYIDTHGKLEMFLKRVSLTAAFILNKPWCSLTEWSQHFTSSVSISTLSPLLWMMLYKIETKVQIATLSLVYKNTLKLDFLPFFQQKII